MADSTRARRTASIACPHCGTESGGSFSTVSESDEVGPTRILFKCKGCGRFYTAERVTSWRVKKT